LGDLNEGTDLAGGKTSIASVWPKENATSSKQRATSLALGGHSFVLKGGKETKPHGRR